MQRRKLSYIGVVGALAAATLGVVVAHQAGAGPSVPSAFVPITPCRLIDTRPGTQVGTRGTPIVQNETATFAVWATNGLCTIPATATGIATNTTIANPTQASFLTVFPADALQPTASNLNWTATSSPTPNQVTVGLSATGAIKVFNLNGTVDLIVDIVGYYQPETGGPPGPPGTPGTAGATGPRGISSFDNFPSNQVVKGESEFRGYFGLTDDIARFSVSFQALTGADLTFSDVEFGANAAINDANPVCTGSFLAPTAPSGVVCIYLGASTNNAKLINGQALASQKKSGFRVEWTTVASGVSDVHFSWAYHEPLHLSLVLPVDDPSATPAVDPNAGLSDTDPNAGQVPATGDTEAPKG